MAPHMEIRPMSVRELETVLSWAADEGWNPGLADARAFHAADPGGFFIAHVEDEPVAAVSVVNHDAANAFLGLYICRPGWRGRGIGLATWEAGLAHAGERSIGLDGVPEQEDNYRLSGFTKTGSTLRHEGRVEGRRSPDIRAASGQDREILLTLDARANGFNRLGFGTAWLTDEPGLRGTRVLTRAGEIAGFVTWRACGTGTKVGPIIAPDLTAALDLLHDIAEIRQDGPLIVDVPEAIVDLRRALEGAGFTIPFVTARMYRGKVPTGDGSLQAIATMELG